MAAVLGMRGSGNFSTDERPKNWREAIMLLFPNGEAPLTAILSMLKSEITNDPEYNWWEKRLPTQRFQVNGAHGAGVTTIAVTSGAKDCVTGTILLNERLNEIVKVVADPSDDVEIEVSRSFGAVAAATWNNEDWLVVIGNVNSEGAKTPTARSYAPTKKSNYTEIFRASLSLTRTARRTRLRWDNQGPYREARREALSLHSIEMEKAYIWGESVEVTGSNGFPERMTGGILSFLTTNKGTTSGGSAGTNTDFNVNGALSEDTLDALMEELFRYGSNEKLALCGSTFLRAITTLAKRNGNLQMIPRAESYGMKIVEYVSAFGSLMMKNHPLFSQHPVWRQNCLVVDPKNIRYRYIDDTMFIKGRQEAGEDASKDEFLNESGLEVNMEETHGYIEGVTGALIA